MKQGQGDRFHKNRSHGSAVLESDYLHISSFPIAEGCGIHGMVACRGIVRCNTASLILIVMLTLYDVS
jgi:hypothetical protein